MKNHENPPGIIKSQPGTMKNYENRPGTMKNHKNPPGTMKTTKNQHETMKNHSQSCQKEVMIFYRTQVRS